MAAEEARLGEEREASGLRWFGRRKCLEINPYEAPVKPWIPFSRRPKVASKNDGARRYRILRQKRFCDLYDTAKKEFREGNRDVAFPEGTFFMRVYWAFAVEPFLQTVPLHIGVGMHRLTERIPPVRGCTTAR